VAEPSSFDRDAAVSVDLATEPGPVFELTAILVAYVLPLAIFTVVLIAAHLALIAVALLTVEGLVVLAIVIARRRPPRPAGMAPPSRRPWLIPAAMIVIFAAIVGVAVLAASRPS
jgi:amino acid transporter